MKNMYRVHYYMYMIGAVFSAFLGGYLIWMNKVYLLEYNMFIFGVLMFNYMVMVDWVGILFISLILFITSNVVSYSENYMEGDKSMLRFLGLIFLFVLSMLLMVISPNLVSILLGWDGLGLISYCLVIYYQNWVSYNSGMITILMNRVGDFGLIMSIVLFYVTGWKYYEMDSGSLIGFMMILLASVTKSAQFPFSAWLPAAMAAPTPISALVHSSTLVTAGVYLLIRFFDTLKSTTLDKVLMLTSIFTILVSGLCALYEQDLKKIVAMSTLSQLGFMMFILSLGEWKLAYFHMMTHALFKSMLFLSVGNVMHSFFGGQDMRFQGGCSSYLPYSGLGFLISSMCLFSLPFVSGYYSKEKIIFYFMTSSYSLLMMMMMFVGVSLTIMYMYRLLLLSLFANFSGGAYNFIGEGTHTKNMIYFLGLGSIFMGSCLEWVILSEDEQVFFSKSLSWMPMFLFLFVFMGLLLYNFFMESNNYRYLKFSMNKLLHLHYFGVYFFKSANVMKYANNNEIYWGEMMGAQGVVLISVKLMSVFFSISNMNYNKMLFVFLFVYLFMLF